MKMKHIAFILSLILINTTSFCCKSQKNFNFLNIQNRTSSLIFTDGEATLLPYFSGENATNLYTVYFLGRTEREREYWDVYNKNGFWKGKDSEQMHIYIKDIEQYINANIKQYYIFAIAIEKRMIKETAENEFLPNSAAVYKTYLLTDGKWIATDSFNVQETPKETAEYLINILNKRSNGEVKLLRDSLAEGSIASCVRNGKQYVIDGFILNLPGIDEEDFKFEKRNDTLYITPLTYFTLDGTTLVIPKDIRVINLQESIIIGIKQETTDDTPAAWLDFSSERSRLIRNIKQKYNLWTSQKQEDYLYRHHWSTIKDLSIQFQKTFYDKIIENQIDYKECCPEYIEQAKQYLAMKKESVISFEQLHAYPQIKGRTITLSYRKKQKSRHIVIVETFK